MFDTREQAQLAILRDRGLVRRYSGSISLTVSSGYHFRSSKRASASCNDVRERARSGARGCWLLLSCSTCSTMIKESNPGPCCSLTPRVNGDLFDTRRSLALRAGSRRGHLCITVPCDSIDVPDPVQRPSESKSASLEHVGPWYAGSNEALPLPAPRAGSDAQAFFAERVGVRGKCYCSSRLVNCLGTPSPRPSPESGGWSPMRTTCAGEGALRFPARTTDQFVAIAAQQMRPLYANMFENWKS